MARYIDADALTEHIQKLKVVTDDWFGMGIARGIERAETAIQMQPTADVVEVVRCKDCKLAEIVTTNIGTKYIECQSHEVYMEANDFCSYGKRKSEE